MYHRAVPFLMLIRMGGAVLLPAALSAQASGEIVSPIPDPTGRFAVGTAVAYLRDRARTDPEFPGGRPVTLQLWFPAVRATRVAAPYLMERALLATLHRYSYYGIDSMALDQWATVPTHAFVDAVPAAGTYPLVAFSVGLGVIRANYTSIVVDLASHGYIVAMVESPLQGLMVLPDGDVIADTLGRYGEPVGHRAGVAAWSRDISYVLDNLASPTTPDLAAIASHVDFTRIGALGHSSGGLVAIAACEADRRIRACVNMDGGLAGPKGEPLADFVPTGVSKPTLILRSHPIYDDTTLARRGITREQWVKRGESGRLALEALVNRSRGRVWLASVAGTGHFSFTDAPFVMPSAITRFGGRIIAPTRGWTVIGAALRAFFDQELGRPGEDLAAAAQRFPELAVTAPNRS